VTCTVLRYKKNTTRSSLGWDLIFCFIHVLCWLLFLCWFWPDTLSFLQVILLYFFFPFVVITFTIMFYCAGLELQHLGQNTITGKQMLGVTFHLRWTLVKCTSNILICVMFSWMLLVFHKCLQVLVILLLKIVCWC